MALSSRMRCPIWPTWIRRRGRVLAGVGPLKTKSADFYFGARANFAFGANSNITPYPHLWLVSTLMELGGGIPHFRAHYSPELNKQQKLRCVGQGRGKVKRTYVDLRLRLWINFMYQQTSATLGENCLRYITGATCCVSTLAPNYES